MDKKTFLVKGAAGDCPIHVGECLSHIHKHSPDNTVVITDEKVHSLYKQHMEGFPVLFVGQGEKNKTLATMESLYGQLVNLGADRSWFILGIGGGIVCDVAGFTASTYMRGLDFGFVASTLLAQVDASVGGKNGVNYEGYKNMVGTFNQPAFVVCDTSLLTTLPQEELASGFAEIIKHGAIYDEKYLAFLEKNAGGAMALESGIIDRLVYGSVEIKARVVSADERESGERKKLNFGHTFGHALEKVAGVSHGHAVAAGMAAAAKLSVMRGLLPPQKARRLENLITQMNLPVHIHADKKLVLEALTKDKKRHGGYIWFVLLEDLGHARLEKIPITDLEKAWDTLAG